MRGSSRLSTPGIMLVARDAGAGYMKGRESEPRVETWYECQRLTHQMVWEDAGWIENL